MSLPLNKKPEYKDKPAFNINVAIEKKFKDGYKECLKKIFANLTHKIVEFNKE
jgi:hypothetical protein